MQLNNVRPPSSLGSLSSIDEARDEHRRRAHCVRIYQYSTILMMCVLALGTWYGLEDRRVVVFVECGRAGRQAR